MGFDRLINILGDARMRYPSFAKRLEEAEALGRWEVAVGPIIAKHSRAIKVEESVLWVEVDHPIWKSELHHRKRQILEILNGQTAESVAESLAHASAKRGPKNTSKTSRKKDPSKKDAPLPTLVDILFLDARPRRENPHTKRNTDVPFRT